MLAHSLAFAATLAAAPTPARPTGPIDSLAALLTALAPLPPGPERTLRASEFLRDRPYVHHPLGDGAGPDPATRFRIDAFDCQTYVETSLALGQGRSEAEVRAALDDLRYAGPPAFATRNHYMMSQWVPSNVAKGYLAPPPPAEAVAEKRVTARGWAARSPRDIDLPADRIPLGAFSLPLTPLDRLLARAPEIPGGTVMLIVRADRPWTPDRVTHLGFVVQRGGQTYFRHASDVFHRVIDEPIAHFVRRNARYAYRVVGVSLLPLRDNGARVAMLSGN